MTHNELPSDARNCDECGQTFLADVGRKQRFCSPGCRDEFWRHEGRTRRLKLRFDIFRRDGFRCQYCGRSPRDDGVTLEVDHILPKAKYGRDELDNLITACRECNIGKGDSLV